MSGAAPPSGRTFSAVVGLLLVTLLLPSAAAAPIEADLQFTGTPRLEGAGTWTASDGLLKLDAGDSVPPYGIQIEAARAVVTTITWTETWFGVPPVYEHEGHGEETEETTTYDDARLVVENLRPGAAILFVDEGWDLNGHFEAAELYPVRDIMASVDPREDDFSDGSPGAEDHRGLTQSHSEHRADQIMMRASELALTAAGDFEFSLYEVDLYVQGSQGATTYDSGTDSDVDSGLFADAIEQKRHRVTVVKVLGGHIDIHWGGTSDLVATTPSIGLDGTLQIPSTTGDVLYDEVGVRAHQDPLQTSGEIVLAPHIEPGADVLPYDAIEDATVYYQSARMGISGDAAQVSVAANRIANPFQDHTSLVATGATGVGVLAALYAAWRWGPLAFWALYSRIERGSILDNPTRAQIYDIICSNPGISARGVHELADASWGTVVHHLTKLEDSGYVTVATNGRAKCFYENHGKWEGHQAQLALLTREKTRRIAEAVAAVGGRDQSALVERTGLPQSTVSYHLLKLEAAGLITKDRNQNSTAYFSTLQLRSLFDRLGSLSVARNRPGTEAAS